MKDKKRPVLLCAAVSGSRILVFFPYSSWRPKSFKIETSWSDTSMVWPWKLMISLSPFSTWVLTGARILTKRSQRAPTFVMKSPSPLEMAYTVELYNLLFSFVEALVPTIAGNWYEHLFRTIVLSPPERQSFSQSFLGKFSVGSYSSEYPGS